MKHSIKRYVLTPSQAAEKELILDQIRIHPRGPWLKGKKITLPKTEGTTLHVRKKN